MQPLCKTVWWMVPQKTKNRATYDPVIPLLGIYLEKMKTLIWKDTCAPKFTAALFTIAKIWKKSVSINRAMVNIYKGIPLAIKKNEILPFSTTWINLEGIMLSEIIRERKTNTICYHVYVESKK